jgi:hypothetical protein
MKVMSKKKRSHRKLHKKVTFCATASVVLIPSAKEYHSAGLIDILWWNDLDYHSFKSNAAEDIKEFMVTNRSVPQQGAPLNMKTTLKLFFQQFQEEVDIRNTQDNLIALKPVLPIPPQPTSASPTEPPASVTSTTTLVPTSTLPPLPPPPTTTTAVANPVIYDSFCPTPPRPPTDGEEYSQLLSLSQEQKQQLLRNQYSNNCTNDLSYLSSFVSPFSSYPSFKKTIADDENNDENDKENNNKNNNNQVALFARMLVFGFLVLINRS